MILIWYWFFLFLQRLLHKKDVPINQEQPNQNEKPNKVFAAFA